MRVMTSRTFTALHRGVDDRFLQLLREVGVTPEADLRLIRILQAVGILLAAGRQLRPKQHHHRYACDRQTPTHGCGPHLITCFFARWQSVQDFMANGGWTFCLKKCSSFEACASWQRSQCITDGSIWTCASLKAAVRTS